MTGLLLVGVFTVRVCGVYVMTELGLEWASVVGGTSEDHLGCTTPTRKRVKEAHGNELSAAKPP